MRCDFPYPGWAEVTRSAAPAWREETWNRPIRQHLELLEDGLRGFSLSPGAAGSRRRGSLTIKSPNGLIAGLVMEKDGREKLLVQV